MLTDRPDRETVAGIAARTRDLYAVEIRSVAAALAQSARLVVPGGGRLDLSLPDQSEFARLSLSSAVRQHRRRGEDLALLVERITAMLQASTRRTRGAGGLDAGLHLVRAIAMAEILAKEGGVQGTGDDPVLAQLVSGAPECLARSFAARQGTHLPAEVAQLFPAFATLLGGLAQSPQRTIRTSVGGVVRSASATDGATRRTRGGGASRADAGAVVALRQVSLFRHLTDEQLARFAAVLTRHDFRRGGPVVRAGETPERLYFVAAGRLKVALRDGSGQEAILGFLGPGDVFDEMSVIDGAPHSATLTALGPCELLGLDRTTFGRALHEDLELCLGLVHRLIDRVRRADRRIGGFVSLDVRGRVTRTLQEIAVSRHGRQVIERVSRQDIAKMIGASREMVSRVMKELEASGAIERRGSAIFLREPLLAASPRADGSAAAGARVRTLA